MSNLIPNLSQSSESNQLLNPPSGTLTQQINNHFKNNKKRYKNTFYIAIILVIFASGGLGGYWYSQKKGPPTTEQLNPKTAFLLEIYDKIKQNYWEKIPDDQLAGLYKLGAEKITNRPQSMNSLDKEGVKNLADRILSNLNDQEQKELAVNLGDMVLANLKPFNRSRLFTITKEKELRETVSNIDRTADLYENLDLDKNASQQQITDTFQTKAAELTKDTSPEGQQKLAQVKRAYEALGDKASRQIYDSTGIEPTVLGKIFEPDIYYIQIKRISPTTFDEFQKVANSVSNNKNLNNLILDLRSNIGGAIDILPYFLGFFVGENTYAYEFYHQGEPQPFKTKTGWLNSLVKYKKVVILTDGATQSSAEVIAASLKKYNVGVVLGSPTKGWGTVENTFPLNTIIDPNEAYSIFMVHSLTLRDDGQPIEGKGVDPLINLSDPTWPEQLYAHFNYQGLIDTIKKIIAPTKTTD
ncbi:DnaJ domain-containing protein [Patescibacteria group bacterium]|nr:DnaJ domain-containing protein [Patescibacteria group bacterium]